MICIFADTQAGIDLARVLGEEKYPVLLCQREPASQPIPGVVIHTLPAEDQLGSLLAGCTTVVDAMMEEWPGLQERCRQMGLCCLRLVEGEDPAALLPRLTLEPPLGSWFPTFIPLKGERVLVIGAGQIAGRRIRTLLSFGAAVTVIAPEISQEMALLEETGQLNVCRRPAVSADVTVEYRLVVAASSDRDCNHEIGKAARVLGIPVSVADCRSESSFFFPAIIAGSGIVGGVISQGGTDHHRAARQAARLRQLLAETEETERGTP